MVISFVYVCEDNDGLETKAPEVINQFVNWKTFQKEQFQNNFRTISFLEQKGE